MKLAAHATVLLVDDIVRATDFYRDKLGFEVTFYEANPRHYAYAARDDVYVHFACVAGVPPRPNHPEMFDLYIYVDDLDSLHRELVERGAELLEGPVERDYGMRDLRLVDPHGYELAFGQTPE